MKSITQVVQNLIKPYIDSHNRAAEAIIAPVETDATSASDDYAIGKQLILNNVLYDVIAPITAGDALVVNTNIKAANNVSSDIDALTKKLEDEAATRSAMGAKNRLPITLASLKQTATAGTWANNVYTENGIDFTINTDASDYVTSIVVSGTASGVASINLLGTGAEYAANDFAGMILTGCPSGGGNDNYRTVVFIGDSQDGTGHTTQYEDGTGVTIGTNAYIRIYLRIASGTNLTTPITFYPMIRLASDTDSTYQPYAMTNRELTAENQTLTNLINQKSTYQYPSNITSGTLANAIATVYAAVPFTSGVAIALVSSDVTGRPVGTGWGVIILYVCAGTQNCHVVYQDTWSSKAVDGMFNASNSTVAWNPYIPDNFSNPNLLDNPWFTVNQRGFTSGAVTNETYPLDRWKFADNDSNITVSSGTNGLSIVGTPTNTGENLIWQAIEYDRIPNSVGKVITLSLMLADGTVYKSSHVLVSPTSSWQLQASLDCDTFQVHLLTEGTTPSMFQLFFKSTDKAINATIRAIKLELGTVSTLAHDTAPNYQQELAKCQRYFQRVKASNNWTPMFTGLYTNDSVRAILPLLVALRTTPTLSVSDATKLTAYCNGQTATGASLSVNTYKDNDSKLYLSLTLASGITSTNYIAIVFANDADFYIDLSADL